MITKTSEASFRTEIAQYQEELDLSVINDQAETKGKRTNKFNETEYNKIKELIPSFNKKYENVLAVEEDKLVYKGTDKTLYRMALNIGLISEDELLDDEILEELQPFITEWTVEAGDTITLPIGGTCNFIVDYGDGSAKYEVTSSSDADKSHTYPNAGTYTVTIKGNLTEFKINNNVSKDKLIKIIQWGNVGCTNLNFWGCSNLKGPIPEPSKNTFLNMTSMNQLFQDCTRLNGEIPEKIFYNCPNVKSFYFVFRNCSNLTGSIPENLFKNCSEVTSFSGAFSGCSNLTGEIPEKLFSNNLKVTDLGNVFRGCERLTGNIPERIFTNHVDVSTIGGVFGGCSGLTGKIPEDLFKDCTKIISANDIFVGCTGLTGVIPEKLFENNTLISSFYSTFNGCTGLTGNAPALWNRANDTTGSFCFSNCRNLSNYNQIPSSWGGGGT